MEDNFKLEIISPERIVFSDNVKMVKFPSYEGDMGILKNHISIISFLKPGIVKVEKNEENIANFFVQDGIAEFFNDNLVLLSATIENTKNLSEEFLQNLKKTTQDKLEKNDITDRDRYILNHKLDVLNEIKG
jgi:ATP synthase F1 epsilon subunit